MDRTLILVKPDAFERGLTGEIIGRFECKGLKIVAMKHMTVERELAEQHYAEHAERPFFGELVDFITGGPLVALVLEGHEAVKAARQVIGATNPIEAAPGSIRGDYGSPPARPAGGRSWSSSAWSSQSTRRTWRS
jgi:nucleoside-diphosphate kinase